MIRLRQVSLVTSCRVLAILGTAAGLRTNHWWQWQQRDHWWIITCHLWLDWFVTSKGMSKCHVLLNSDLKKSISVFVYSAIHSKLFTWPRWFLLQPSYGKARGTRALLFSFRHEVTWLSCVIFFQLDFGETTWTLTILGHCSTNPENALKGVRWRIVICCCPWPIPNQRPW